MIRAIAAVIALIVCATAPAQAQNWPTRTVKFIVPFGAGAGADIGARLFADKLAAEMGPAGGGREQARRRQHRRDPRVPRRQRRSRAAVRAGRQLHRASVRLQQAELQSGRPDPDRACLQHHPGGRGRQEDAPYSNVKEFTEAARAAPGKFNSGLVQGITEFTFWGYQHHEKLQITQVPYRDINVAPVDLGEGRIQVVMASLAVVQPQSQAGRIKLFTVNNKTRVKAAPDVPTAREQGYPSLEVGGPGRPVRTEVDVERAEGEDRRRLPRCGRRRQHRRAARRPPARSSTSADRRSSPNSIDEQQRAFRGGREGDRLQAEELISRAGLP